MAKSFNIGLTVPDNIYTFKDRIDHLSVFINNIVAWFVGIDVWIVCDSVY